MKKILLLSTILVLSSCSKDFKANQVDNGGRKYKINQKLSANFSVENFSVNPNTFTMFFFPKVSGKNVGGAIEFDLEKSSADIDWVHIVDRKGVPTPLYSLGDTFSVKIAAMTNYILDLSKAIDVNDKKANQLKDSNVSIKDQMIAIEGCWDSDMDEYINTHGDKNCEEKNTIYVENSAEYDRLTYTVKSELLDQIQKTIDAPGRTVNWQNYGDAPDYTFNVTGVFAKRNICIKDTKDLKVVIETNQANAVIASGDIAKINEEIKKLDPNSRSYATELKALQDSKAVIEADLAEYISNVEEAKASLEEMPNCSKIAAEQNKIEIIMPSLGSPNPNKYATFDKEKLEKAIANLEKQNDKNKQIQEDIDNLDPADPDYAKKLKKLEDKLSKGQNRSNKLEGDVKDLSNPSVFDAKFADSPFSPGTKLLTFKVKEKDADGNETGRIWDIELEQMDFVSNIRFQGDVKIYFPNSKKIQQRGALKFELSKF